MAINYRPAPGVAAVGRELVRAHHRHLLGVRIEYLFCDKTPMRAGRELWGQARRISSLSAFLAGKQEEGEMAEDFFVIVISAPVWQTLSDEKRVALVDHELAHCFVDEKADGTPALKLVPHDLEEFVQIVERHGLWRDDIKRFHAATAEAAQRSLYEEEPEPERELEESIRQMRQGGQEVRVRAA